MSTIRLENVTKTYRATTSVASPGRSGGLWGRQVDRAFANKAEGGDVVARHLSVHKTPAVALDHLNLTIPDGQTFSIVGPSGCGKSTLLRIVAGLEPDFTGRVLYDDLDMIGVDPKDRYIGMVFQNYALYPNFTGKGNLGFFFKMRKTPDEEAEERIRITSEMMGIGFSELLKRKPGKLSGGEQQRIAVGRALVRKPRVFLFDEPLSNLDAKLRAQTRIEIKQLLSRFRITAIYVTHDQVEAVALGDRIAVMRDGKIEQEGTYQELRQDPVNAFVAGFLGNPPMNLLDGGIVVNACLQLGKVLAPLPQELKSQVSPGQKLTLGVRPESVFLCLGDMSPPEGIRLRGRVESVELDFAHRSQFVHLRTGKFSYIGKGSIEYPLHIGDEVPVVFLAEHLYFFDTESGRRIGQTLRHLL